MKVAEIQSWVWTLHGLSYCPLSTFPHHSLLLRLFLLRLHTPYHEPLPISTCSPTPTQSPILTRGRMDRRLIYPALTARSTLHLLMDCLASALSLLGGQVLNRWRPNTSRGRVFSIEKLASFFCLLLTCICCLNSSPEYFYNSPFFHSCLLNNGPGYAHTRFFCPKLTC
jgi:hypothetical protein